MQLGRFRDGQGNTHHDMYTLTLTDEFVADIRATGFEQKIDVLIIEAKGRKRLGNKKATIPYVKEIYTYRNRHIFRYEIEQIVFRKFSHRNTGCHFYSYRLQNVYQQKKETIEPLWLILGMDKVCMEKENVKELLENYKRKDKYKFIERF